MYKLMILLPALFFLNYWNSGENIIIPNTEVGGLITYKIGSTISEDEVDEYINSLEADQKQHASTVRMLMGEFEKMEFQLKFNNTKSLFAYNESLDENDDDMLRNIALISLSGKSLFFKDIAKEKRIKQEQYKGQLVNVEESFKKYDWDIIDETKELAGYVCKKATTTVKRLTRSGEVDTEITVWFAPDIPVPFGPFGVDGVPGLVLEMSRGGNQYFYASEVMIGKDVVQENEIKLPKGAESVSEEKWNEFHQKESERIRNRQ